MGTLRIWLFGALRLDHEDFEVDPALLHPAQGLLAYLLLNRERLHSREVLAGIFWGDRSDGKARRCLNTALWRLRSALEPEGIARGAYLISTDRRRAGFQLRQRPLAGRGSLRGAGAPGAGLPGRSDPDA